MKIVLDTITMTDEVKGPYFLTKFDPGDSTLRTGDYPAPQRAGSIPGVDYESDRTWEMDILVLGESDTDVLDRTSALTSVWRPRGLEDSGWVTPLKYEIGGRWRRVYGRPGRISDPQADWKLGLGAGEVITTFRVTDPNYYDEHVNVAELGIVPPTTGGFVFPLTFPWTSTVSGAPESVHVDVAGDAPSPLEVTFRGPVSNPWVRVGGNFVQLRGTIAYDDEITIDGRTRTVVNSFGQSVPWMLSPRTRMTTLMLRPGQHTVSYGGNDVTGSSSVRVRWRNTWRSY